MKVEVTIKPHRIGEELAKVGESRFLYIRNVWNQNDLIEIEHMGNKVEVSKFELLKAIENATGNERR